MKHFNEVFLVIKEHCGDTNTINGDQCLKLVTKYLETDEEYKLAHLKDHLTILKNLGLITYKGDDDLEISLTELGMKTNRIPITSF